MNDHILYAYSLTKTQTDQLSEGDILEKLKSDSPAWVHLDVRHQNTRSWLKSNFDYLDSIIIDALLAEETRPRMTQHDDGTLIILRGVNLSEGKEPEDMVSIRLWIDQNRIISLQRNPIMAVKDIAARIEKGKGPKNSADFLVSLITRLLDKMEPVISDLDEQTDLIEELIIDTPDASARHSVMSLRKKAIMLRRYIAPQKDVISYLRNSDLTWITPQHKRHIQESQDRITRYVEDLDAIRDRAQIIKDELATLLADKMNKNMYVLSVIAAIFLPLGFLTGLLGINVGGMPGADNAFAFWIVCALCVAFAVGLITIFKKLKWF